MSRSKLGYKKLSEQQKTEQQNRKISRSLPLELTQFFELLFLLHIILHIKLLNYNLLILLYIYCMEI